MECEEARPRLDAYLDGELGAAERASLREHIAGCHECGPEAAALERLRAGIRAAAPVYRAPPELHTQIRAALRRERIQAAAPSWRAPGWLAYAASILIAVAVGSGGTYVLTGERQENAIANEVIDSHLRSLLAGHLTDVASSDKHTVKPWFAGRTELSPPGVDLAAQGFPLIGGRLDLVAGEPVPALVYRAGKHIINVFVLPEQKGDFGKTVRRGGYTLHHWTAGGLGYWAVSDAAPDEFAKFERAFRAATSGG
ncbi:MAG TPA: anti-sigma factor [Stellaceae bacterium]|jgi:anti-sigma factor (TIGR02949 family)